MTLIERLKAGGRFEPTPELIRCCENALIAKAHVETVRPIVEGYQQAILAAGNYQMSEKMYRLRKERGAEPEDTRILDPERSYMMGDADFKVYHAACQQAAKDANLKVSRPDNCPLLEAESLLRDAENALMEVFANEMGDPKLASPILLEMRTKLLDIIYAMVAPHVNSAQKILRRLVA